MVFQLLLLLALRGVIEETVKDKCGQVQRHKLSEMQICRILPLLKLRQPLLQLRQALLLLIYRVLGHAHPNI